MKPSYFSRLFIVFFVIFASLTQNISVSASTEIEDLDPTQDYSVHALPAVSTEPQVVIHSEKESPPKLERLDTTSLLTATPVVEESIFTRFMDFVSESVTIAKRGVSVTGHFVGKAARSAYPLIYNTVRDHGLDWTFNIAVLSATSIIGFFVFSDQLAKSSLKISLKSSTDLQIRFVSLVSAIAVSVTAGTAWLVTYHQQIAFFETQTGWRLNPLGQDLLVVGSVLGAGLLFTVGGTLLVASKSAWTSLVALLPTGKKVTTYFAKETKSAFTETDKECAETVGKCSSLFDKTVILAFNYLPGTMPDLGLDDAIIHFKNSLFKTPATQKLKAK